MSDDNRAIVPVCQHGVVVSVRRQIAITEKLLGRTQDKGCTSIHAGGSELIGNLIYTDPQNGLMWAKNGNIAGGDMDWENAMNWAKNLKYAGYNDWRLPSIEEFEVFAKWGKWGESGSLERLNSNGFNNVKSYGYWSSTVVDSEMTRAYLLDINYPFSYSKRKIGTYNVWPVRDGQQLGS